MFNHFGIFINGYAKMGWKKQCRLIIEFCLLNSNYQLIMYLLRPGILRWMVHNEEEYGVIYYLELV